jgi:hypothetical protein
VNIDEAGVTIGLDEAAIDYAVKNLSDVSRPSNTPKAL